MPFKFKLGRKKSGSPAAETKGQSHPTGTSSFRVIPRSGASGARKGAAVADKPLPSLGHHGRSWSEEDTSSSNRASDSTTSTNHSRAFDNHSYNRSSTSYGDKSRKSDAQFGYNSGTPGGAERRDFLDMPSAFHGQDEFSEMFKSNEVESSDRRNYETPARYSKQSKTPPLHNSRSAELNPSPLSLQSFSSDEESLSTSFGPPSQDQAPIPPLHKSPPVKIQTFDVMRNAVSPSFSDDYKTDSWEPPVMKRMESTESFTRSAANVDADANMVRNSVLIRRDTSELLALRDPSPTRPAVAPRRSSLHPPPQPPPHSSSLNSSQTSSTTPSVSSTASSQGQNLFDASTTPKPTTPTIGQLQPPSNNTTPRALPPRQTATDSDSDDEPIAHTMQKRASNPRLSMMPPVGNPSRLSIVPQQSNGSRPPISPQDSHGSRLSVIPAEAKGSRLSVIPPESKRLSRFDDLRPVSTASGESDISQGKTRSSGEHNLSVPKHSNAQTPATTPPFGATPSPSARQSMVSQSGLSPIAPGQTLPNVDFGSRLSDDDDDDVPLALLPATNPPIRGRMGDPRMSQQSFMSPSRPASTFGAASVAGGRNSLPPFARRLPHDPYGSPEGVLNASRESLLLNRPTHNFPPGQSPVPGMPPGGLVGVIAEEERSKSWRRAAGAGQVGLNPGMSMGMQGPMSIPGLGHGLMGGQQMAPGMGAEQTQFNHQLVQLVQQQSVMLQQMQAMMQQQQYAGSVAGYAEPDFAQQSPGSPGLRPRSMLNTGMRTRSMVNLSRPPNAPRTMSMISTGAHYPAWGAGAEPLISSATSVRGMANGYASSVAPSERSTIGQPNRYRPVTTPQAMADTQSKYGGYNRSSMANAPMYGPLAGSEEHDDLVAKKKKSGFFSAIIHPRGRNAEMQPEEEEDWGSFASKRRSTMPNTLK